MTQRQAEERGYQLPIDHGVFAGMEATHKRKKTTKSKKKILKRTKIYDSDSEEKESETEEEEEEENESEEEVFTSPPIIVVDEFNKPAEFNDLFDSQPDEKYWFEFADNQVLLRMYNTYSNKHIKKSSIKTNEMPSSEEFKMDMIDLSPFGVSLFIKLLKLSHEGNFTPKFGEYVLIENVLDPSTENSMKMFTEMAMIQTTDWRDINDHYTQIDDPNDVKISKGRRKMKSISNIFNKSHPAFMNDIKIILHWLFPLHSVCDEHLFITEFGCLDQRFHTDDQYNFSKIISPNEIMSYDALVALYNPVYMRYKKSVITPDNQAEEIKIPPFGMMLFCGNTVHSGTGWREENMEAPRIHFYIDPPGRKHDDKSQSFINVTAMKLFETLTGFIFY